MQLELQLQRCGCMHPQKRHLIAINELDSKFRSLNHRPANTSPAPVLENPTESAAIQDH